MRVMPSVTDTIVPTLRASVTPLKFSIRCLIRSLISVALMAMVCATSISSVDLASVVLSSELVGDALEARPQRAVDYQITGAQNRTADQFWIRRAVQPYLALEPALHRGGQRRQLPIGKRRGGSHRHVDH